MANIKPRSLSISFMIFIVLLMNSCFLKPKHHHDDHRGVYKDKGVTPDQKRYLEELKRKNHPGRYTRKKHVKTHKLKEDHHAKKDKDLDAPTPVTDTSHAPVPPVPPAPPSTPSSVADTSVHTGQQYNALPDTEHSTEQPSDPGKTSRKERKKHKKSKKSGAV